MKYLHRNISSSSPADVVAMIHDPAASQKQRLHWKKIQKVPCLYFSRFKPKLLVVQSCLLTVNIGHCPQGALQNIYNKVYNILFLYNKHLQRRSQRTFTINIYSIIYFTALLYFFTVDTYTHCHNKVYSRHFTLRQIFNMELNRTFTIQFTVFFTIHIYRHCHTELYRICTIKFTVFFLYSRYLHKLSQRNFTKEHLQCFFFTIVIYTHCHKELNGTFTINLTVEFFTIYIYTQGHTELYRIFTIKFTIDIYTNIYSVFFSLKQTFTHVVTRSFTQHLK